MAQARRESFKLRVQQDHGKLPVLWSHPQLRGILEEFGASGQKETEQQQDPSTAQLLRLRVTQPPVPAARQKGCARSQSSSPHLISSLRLKVMGTEKQGRKTHAIFRRQHGEQTQTQVVQTFLPSDRYL